VGFFDRYQIDIAAVYDRNADTMYRVALAQMQNSEDAEDAVQDVFAKFISAAPRITDEEHERAWLIRATVNRCHDLQRRRKVRTHLDLDEVVELADADSSDKDAVMDLMSCLALIPEKNRSAIVLHYLEDRSVEQTAEILGITVSAVKMRLSRGREMLKELVGEERHNV